MPIPISDEQWFEAVAHPEAGAGRFGFALPGMPPVHVQKRYNALHGEETLRRAFAIYRCFRSCLPAVPDPMIMDFGAGWGRIARFFLRDTAADRLWAVDPDPKSVVWMRRTGLPCRIVKSEPLPPIAAAAQERFDLIYANSVFSHLSEDYFNAWMPHLLSLLRPGGRLVFTSRGEAFLDRVEAQSARPGWKQKKAFGDVGALRSRYARGEFIFVRNRDDDAALSGSFFGHALVPRGYFESRYPGRLLEFRQHVPGLSKAVFVAGND